MKRARTLAVTITAATMALSSALAVAPASAERPLSPPHQAVGHQSPTAAGGSKSWLFAAVSATGRTRPLTPGAHEDERFVLKLIGVPPITKFTDRPFRDATLISPSTLVRQWREWFAKSPPNAVLTFQDSTRPGSAPSSFVVTLRSPRYQKATDSLIFTAVRIYRLHDPSDGGRGRTSTPARFTGASLFIDDAYNCGPGANCRGMDVSWWDLHDDYFVGADWSYVNADFATMYGINLSQINGFGAMFAGANLEDADFYGANLAESSLSKVDASLADFSYANLQNADLSYGNFAGASFSHANLTGANVTGANFNGADFTGALTADLYDSDTQNAVDAGLSVAEHVGIEIVCAAIPPPFDLLCEAVGTAVEEYLLASGT